MPTLSRVAPELDPVALFSPFAHFRRLALAVSGGADSLALLLLACRWRDAGAATELIVYSVDHRLRREAAEEAAMVVREATKLGVPARILVWNGRKPAAGIQAAARAARYRLLAAAMAEDGAEAVATAHHLSDQAETVLMRLAHGSGLDGLRGMDGEAVVEGCHIVRPLLGVAVEALRQLVAEAGLRPAQDPGNDDEAYERVRWRRQLPALSALGLDPARLGGFARRAGLAADLVAEARRAVWRDSVETGGGAATVPQPTFAALNPLVAAALLSEMLVVVSGDARAVGLGTLEQLVAQLAGLGPLKTTLHGCTIVADGVAIRVRRAPPRRSGTGAT